MDEIFEKSGYISRNNIKTNFTNSGYELGQLSWFCKNGSVPAGPTHESKIFLDQVSNL